MNATIVRCTATVGLFVAQGCAAGKIGPATSGGDWTRTLAQAEAAASERRYAEADRLLADFAVRNPGTPGAVESAYWRGVLALEPANQDASPLVAVALFEAYGKAAGPLPHRLEADILRHVALKLQSISPSAVASAATQPAGTASAGSGASAADLKARDTEIQRLKDELAKANDELERIKRRLTAPTKPQ